MMNVKMNFDEAKLSDTGMHGNLSKKKTKLPGFPWGCCSVFQGTDELCIG
jgi:hypothetical protein